ncbi:hypothetical protein ACC771_00495, partial [Rhizobium ruizarguesonis]
MSARPPIDSDIRLIWQYIDAAEEAPTLSKDLTPEDSRALARVKVEKVPLGRSAPSKRVFAERLQITKAEKTAILSDALERQIAQRDKDLIAAQKKQTKADNDMRRKNGLRPKKHNDAPEPWRRTTERLESEWVSRDFRRVVTLLIRSNVFSTNGMLPSALDR